MNSKTQKIIAEIEVRFRDLDAMGHVNNAVYFTYMEIARTRFFLSFTNLGDPLQLPVIIVEASCTYMAPARYDDNIQVTVNVTRIGDKSFDLSYGMSNQENRSIASGRTVIVAYDYEDRRAIRIPENMRKSLNIYGAL
jgi:acyl-CoA thioester hydrolase